MNLKKIISVTMAGVLALSLAACSAQNDQSDAVMRRTAAASP